ncbi:MAG: hypothetical protein HGJ94_00545 [Desulfosarcina sp.]|nr:hypothetical protein [Desulfosarcina sp.]MBC2742823.1 hypothetical protein [Desulfosarcina sp.]MBC2765733.1 hypothetical protein [Desulfosarcina sp.]
MIRRKLSLISIASEETISFLMLSKGGSLKTLASLPLEAFLEGAATDLPKAVLQSVNRLLVVPDYWVGNSFHEFQARKKSVIAAFIERKLKLEQPALTEAGDFYNYAVVQGQDRRQQLYSFYLQEAVAYRLYRRLEALGISPLRFTTPALVWQAKLGDMADGFAQKGVGFIHLGEEDCFLYFFFMGQFLFSRQIQLPETDEDAGEIYNLLNYEINQSFYLYSQKTKSSVDTLFMLGPDTAAAQQLTDLLGREVQGLPHLSQETGLPDQARAFPPCRGFTALDLTKRVRHFISYKPLKKELAWRPVQWAGIAVGLVLAILLTVESRYLYSWSAAADRQMAALKSADAEPPDLVLQEISFALEEIGQALQRPSGSGTVMRTLLALPDAVSVNKLSLDVSGTPYLTISAVVHADNPDTFKIVLRAFLAQLNARFDLKAGVLREKDVHIHLDRSEGNERIPVYQIDFAFEIS